MPNLNKTVSIFRFNEYDFEVDQLLDQDPSVYHLYLMDGSKHGHHIGWDFMSVKEAKDFARGWVEGADYTPQYKRP